MSPNRKQRREQSSKVLWGVAVLSLGAHLTVVATTEIHLASTAPVDIKALTGTTFQYSCTADAGLALAARTVACQIPGLQTADIECLDKAWQDFRFATLVCDGLQEAPQAESLALLSPQDVQQQELMPLPETLPEPEVAPVPKIPEPEEIATPEEIEMAKLEDVPKPEPEPEPAPQPQPQKLPEPLSAAKSPQVVEITEPTNSIEPNSASLLSEFNSTVEKQTVARASTEEMVRAPDAKDLPVEEDPTELPEEDLLPGQQSDDRYSEAGAETGADDDSDANAPKAPMLAMRAQEYQAKSNVGEQSGSTVIEANGFAAAKGSKFEQRLLRAREGREETDSGGEGRKRKFPNLHPTDEQLARVVGGGSVDKLDDAESGEFTALNTREWKYASFFNRMKRQVAQNWNPAKAYARYDPTGKRHGSKDRQTLLRVTLRPDGSLSDVIILEASGIPVLDDEAIRAFKLAQPFPNPPADLIESSGLITYSFGFHFGFGSKQDIWRLFR